MKLFKKMMGGSIKRLHLVEITAVVIVAVLLFVAYSSQAAIDIYFQGRLLPGIVIGDRSFGRLSINEAQYKLQLIVDELQEQGATFCHEERCIIINSAFTAINDPDLTYDLFSADNDEAIAQAYKVGRTGSIAHRLIEQWKLKKNVIVIPVTWKLDEQQIKNYLQANFSSFEDPPKNTSLSIVEQTGNYTVSFEDAKDGMVFDYISAVSEARRSLNRLHSPTITLPVIHATPTITNVDTKRLEEQVNQVIGGANWSVTYDEQVWQMNKSTLLSLLELQQKGKDVELGINSERFAEMLQLPKEVIEKIPRDAKFKIENGRVTEFQSSQDGISIDENASWLTANTMFKNTTTSQLSFPLSVNVVPSNQPIKSINNLGITELIGVGKSDFSGSPVNRRHNIAVGSASLNGLLIAPGEEFSLVAALGEIDDTNNYKKELVIKGNKTIPEYGGGLCQVGTTTFRATLDAGLPISERQNHSYRVRYYEPAGTDATIYGPHPDYRFVNDTGNHILIQTLIEDNILIYEFWGTRDGRTIKKTDPIIYNITEPPPTKYVETTDLPIGTIKCTESAHRGADTAFDYVVTYVDGETKKETFKSHYRAWQEVCLIGVEELSDTIKNTSGENSTSTNSFN